MEKINVVLFARNKMDKCHSTFSHLKITNNLKYDKTTLNKFIMRKIGLTIIGVFIRIRCTHIDHCVENVPITITTLCQKRWRNISKRFCNK